MEIKQVSLENMKFIGLEYYGENKNNEIGDMWGKFNFPVVTTIPNRSQNEKMFYGICYGEENDAKGTFHYLASVEVTSLEQIPEGMKGHEIKAGNYAVFTHKGPLQNLMETYNLIYGKWIPEANLKTIGGGDFELYDDDRFDPGSPNSEVDIYVRIGE